MFFAIGLVAGFGAWGFSHVKSRGVQLNPASLWALGFGSVNQDALAIYGYDASTITMAIMANIPQVFLALIYLIYTGIMTTMFIAVDWSHLGTKGNTLIVRSPVGNQKRPLGTWCASRIRSVSSYSLYIPALVGLAVIFLGANERIR